MGKKVDSLNHSLSYITITRLLITQFYFYQHSGIPDDSVVSTWSAHILTVKVSKASITSKCYTRATVVKAFCQPGSPYEAGMRFPKDLSLSCCEYKMVSKTLLHFGVQIVKQSTVIYKSCYRTWCYKHQEKKAPIDIICINISILESIGTFSDLLKCCESLRSHNLKFKQRNTKTRTVDLKIQ